MLEETLAWLVDDAQEWLSGFSRAVGPAYELDVSLLPPEEEFFASFERLFSAAGDLGLGRRATGLPGDPLAVDIMGLAYRLSRVQGAVKLALALQRLDTPAKYWADIERQMDDDEPGIVAQLYEFFGDPIAGRSALARLLFISDMRALEFGPALDVSAPGEPVSVASPHTPIQLIWSAAALAAGAITTPVPLPGVFQCSYHLCQRLFVSPKLGVGGNRRFCSVEHGKRFYAARRMKEKSKRPTTEPPPED